MKIAYYISNHGFGHATRACALIDQFILIGIDVLIITDRPFHLFKKLNPQYAHYFPRATDFGFIQKNILEVDQPETLKRLSEFIEEKDRICEEEISFCEYYQVDLIISDIVPLAFLVGAKLNIPVYAVSNFEWYSLYHHIFHDQNQELYSWIQDAYKLASHSFILPFNGGEGMVHFPNAEKTGLICRKGRNISGMLRKKYHIPPDHSLILCAFQEEIDFDYLSLLNVEQVTVFGNVEVHHSHYIQLSKSHSFTDYIASADVVITKTGYSTIAEVVQYGKKLILLAREGNLEDRLLIKGVSDYPNHHVIPFGKQNTVNWSHLIRDMHSKIVKPKANSNRKLAQRIIELFYKDKIDKKVVIDVGSNNIQMIWICMEKEGYEVKQKSSFVSALAKGMKEQQLSPSGINRAKKILQNLLSLSQSFSENVIITGTSASREAKNISELSGWLERKYRLIYRILSETEEAWLNGKANIHDFASCSDLLTFDIGGGSTEFTRIFAGHISHTQSIPLGVRRFNNLYGDDLVTKKVEIKRLLSTLQINDNPRVLIGLGGVVSNLSAFKQGLTHFNYEKTHKSILTKKEIESFYEHFQNKPFSYMKQVMAFEPQTSSIICSGILMILEIMDFFQVDKIYISDNGLMFGFLYLNEEEKKEFGIR